MTELRSYGDPCGIARALDVVGERWSLLILRELSFGCAGDVVGEYRIRSASPI